MNVQEAGKKGGLRSRANMTPEKASRLGRKIGLQAWKGHVKNGPCKCARCAKKQ